jgi:hypothetical protein
MVVSGYHKRLSRRHLEQRVSDCSTVLLPPPVETGFRERDVRFGFDFHGTAHAAAGSCARREGARFLPLSPHRRGSPGNWAY